MIMRYILLAAILGVVLTACSEPRRTPDGHLMDRPKMSAYGPDDVTRHDTDPSAADGSNEE
ncbi:MAG: hypothetical protein H6936_05995 [Burkholderiales bacterium]|nr:hypothetical protein [Nitrosomonas sp.]MCP5274395.1 hypothetical protein [Burkholderiales bacterium]